MTTCAPQAARCLRQSFAPVSKRLFTNSSVCLKQGPLVNFPPTSSPELDSILSTFRNNVFLPAHLAKIHQDFIYKESLQSYLTGDDPVSVQLQTTSPPLPSQKEKSSHNIPLPPPTLTDPAPGLHTKDREPITLQPLSRTRDEPSTKATIREILDLMKTADDFALLPELFRELQVARRKLTIPMVCQTIRVAAAAGQTGIVIELFRRTEKTGLQINEPEIARQVVRSIFKRAADTEWNQIELNKVTKNANVALRLMEDPKQIPLRADEHSQKLAPALDALTLPDVVGVMLALQAVRLLKTQEGNDEVKGLRRWAVRILSLRENQDLTVPESHWSDANEMLMRWVPVWMGARLAAETLGEDDTGLKLRAWATEIEDMLVRANNIVKTHVKKDRHTGGTSMYDSAKALIDEHD